MKRYELARRKGLNWQVVLIQDCETDIKVLTLESVKRGEDYGTINKKVSSLIYGAMKELESSALKAMAKNTLTQFASRIYLKWLSIYGSYELGTAIIAAMLIKGINVPPNVVNKIKSLPKVNDVRAYNRATPNMTYDREYEKEVVSRVNAILDEQAKEDYSDRYSLRAAVERQVREEWHQKQIETLKSQGVNLVWIDSHANCSERCAPFQAKLYSLDGTSGTIDGIPYRPLSEATDIYVYTKVGKCYKNGCISGFNCRHRLIPYKKGFKPVTIPKEVLEKERNVEIRQRELERNVRRYETRALGWKKEGNKDLYLRYKGLAKKWTEEYVSFSKKNKVPFYPSRLVI